MNDSHPESGFGQGQLGTQNIIRVEFNDAAVLPSDRQDAAPSR